MAQQENLTQFFETAVHAVSATFKTAGGTIIRQANVIFNDAIGNVAVSFDGPPAEGPQPFLQCKTADLTGVDRTCKVTINSVDYRITNDLHDGSGTSLLLLKK